MGKMSIGVAHSAYGYCIWKARNLIIHQGRSGKKTVKVFVVIACSTKEYQVL